MNTLDESKMTQEEMIIKLHNEIIELKEKCKVLNVRMLEAQERVNDYKRMMRAMKAVEAMEAWLGDNMDDDELEEK